MTTRPATIEFSSYLNSLVSLGRSASGGTSRNHTPHSIPIRRSDTTSRAASRARAITAGAGGGERVICAICEGRGAATVVGLCFIITATNECILCNIVDSQTYIRTLQKLDVFDPTEILMPASSHSAGKSKLYSLIENYFGGARIVPTARKQYNASAGMDYLVKWAFPGETETVSYELSDKYFTACAAAVAIEYTQAKYHFDYTTRSIRIKFQASEDSVALTSSTIKSLELVHNAIDLKRGMSLFKLMNRTQTAMGSRMLRSSLLQPLTNQETLIKRQDAVEELYKNAITCTEISKKLKRFEDLDRLLTSMSTVWKNTKKLGISDYRINQLIMLKEAIDCSLEMFEAMHDMKCALLVELREIFGSSVVVNVKSLLATIMTEDCRWAQSALEMRKQKCYAVLSGTNGFLDITRQLYEEYNTDIGEMVRGYTAEHGVQFETKYDIKRGYILKVRNTNFPSNDEGDSLPDIFINKHKTSKFLECTTLEMIKCNTRINNVLSEIILVSDQIIETLFQEQLAPHLSDLFKVSEAVAVLDLLCSFTSLVSSSSAGYVRPQFSTEAAHSNRLALKLARHPILERTMKYKPFIPNDFYASPDTAQLNIITGVNMSGKSIYLRSIALLVIMAQTGCFIPAQYAVLPIYKSLYTRITPDSSDLLSSTFSAEMTEMAYILHSIGSTDTNRTTSTLVIIDELGRGSSVVDGLSITLAIADKLVHCHTPSTITTVFMCTHFQDLPKLMGQRPGVSTLRMKVNIEHDGMTMYYKAMKIPSDAPELHGYGLQVAHTLPFPKRFLEYAETNRQQLVDTNEARKSAHEKSQQILGRKKAIVDLYEALIHMSNMPGDLDEDTLKKWLLHLQYKFIDSVS